MKSLKFIFMIAIVGGSVVSAADGPCTDETLRALEKSKYLCASRKMICKSAAPCADGKNAQEEMYSFDVHYDKRSTKEFIAQSKKHCKDLVEIRYQDSKLKPGYHRFVSSNCTRATVECFKGMEKVELVDGNAVCKGVAIDDSKAVMQREVLRREFRDPRDSKSSGTTE